MSTLFSLIRFESIFAARITVFLFFLLFSSNNCLIILSCVQVLSTLSNMCGASKIYGFNFLCLATLLFPSLYQPQYCWASLIISYLILCRNNHFLLPKIVFCKSQRARAGEESVRLLVVVSLVWVSFVQLDDPSGF